MAYLVQFNYDVPMYFWFGAQSLHLRRPPAMAQTGPLTFPLLSGLIGMIAIASAAHWIQWLQVRLTRAGIARQAAGELTSSPSSQQGYFRRRQAGYRQDSKRLPRVKTHASGDQPTVHHVSLRYVPLQDVRS